MCAQKLLDLSVHNGNLTEIFLKQLVSRLIGIDSVMYESLVALTYPVRKRERGNDEVRVLKHAKICIKGKLLLNEEFSSKELVPNVSRRTGKDNVGIIVLGNHLGLGKYLAVIAANIILEL